MLGRTAASLLAGGLAYTAWLALFLATSDSDGSAWHVTLWVLAPIVTAAGFTLGAVLYERLTHTSPTPVGRLFPWTLTGCAIGAAAIFWYGPMLIVFTMLVGGTIGVFAHDLIRAGRQSGPSPGLR